MPNLVTLPYELRHEIFLHYFTLEGGYAFNAKAEKLTSADGQPINLSLMYTCQLIAAETKDIPLAVNTVTFSTLHRQDLSVLAGRFEYLSKLHSFLEAELLAFLGKFITPEMYSDISLHSPQFAPLLRRSVREYEWAMRDVAFEDFAWIYEGTLRRGMGDRNMFWSMDAGNAPFLMVREAVTYSLRVVAERHATRFADLLAKALPGWTAPYTIDEFQALRFEPWDIPSPSALARVGDRLNDHFVRDLLQQWHPGCQHSRSSQSNDYPSGYRYREKLRFTAAAACIQFLNRLPVEKRLLLRNIVLHEDRLAVGRPECHAMGLIPLCKENPCLRIERRVSMLRNILQKDSVPYLPYLAAMDNNARQGRYCRTLATEGMSFEVGGWLEEALAALGAGMPTNSFTFVLDGEDARDLCSDIFQQVLHRNVAWQGILDQSRDRGILEPQPNNQRQAFVVGGLQEGIEHLQIQTSNLRCNFHPGCFWEIEGEIEARRDWGWYRWLRNWWYREPRYIDIPASLPNWTQLAFENFEREPEGDLKASGQI